MYSGSLTEAGARALMSFRRTGGGPTISNAKGSVKFWLRDGELAKYQAQGRMTWNENEVDIDRETTVEIRDVGTTKVELPAAAKAKLAS